MNDVNVPMQINMKKSRLFLCNMHHDENNEAANMERETKQKSNTYYFCKRHKRKLRLSAQQNNTSS